MLDLFHLTIEADVVTFLVLVAIVAGIIDAIAGGGGLITVPALLIAGIPPLNALGTNRLQAVIGEATSFLTYLYNKEVKLEQLGVGLITTLIGATLGSYAVSLVPDGTLKVLLPILMVAIAIYSVFSNRLKSNKSGKPIMSIKLFMVSMGLIIGFYNGFFGPGTGSIWMIAFVILLGRTIKQASISTKPLNLAGNFISLVFFAYIGQVNYQVGLLMGLGQIFGAIIGSKIVIKNGDKVVRPVFIVISILISIKVVFEQTSIQV